MSFSSTPTTHRLSEVEIETHNYQPNPTSNDRRSLFLNSPHDIHNDGRFSFSTMSPSDSRSTIQGKPRTLTTKWKLFGLILVILSIIAIIIGILFEQNVIQNNSNNNDGEHQNNNNNNNNNIQNTTNISVPSSAPILLYIDALSGPLVGGEHNNGTYLSLFGLNFGSFSSVGITTKVYIGGVEVSNYRSLGPSVTYSKNGIQKLTVQVGNILSNYKGLGSGYGTPLPVTITVNGLSNDISRCLPLTPDAFPSFSVFPFVSNCHFIPNHGSIYFVSLTGNDTTAQANNIALPYRTLQTPTFGGVHEVMVSGDHIVIRGGQWSDIGADSSWVRWRYPPQEGYPPTPSGDVGSGWIHFTSYPGPIMGNANEIVQYTTPSNCKGGFQGANSAYAGTTGDWISISNLHMSVDASATSDASPINVQYSLGPWRAVNNELGPWPSNIEAKAAGVSGHGNGTTVLGNYIHDISSSTGLENHGVYVDSGGMNWEIGYNWISNILGGNLIQFFDNVGLSGNSYVGFPADWVGFTGMLLHHNYMENSGKYGLNMADSILTGMVWNNIVIGATYAGLRVNTISKNMNMVFAFNTFYDNSRQFSGSGTALILNSWGAYGANGTLTVENNIFAAGPNTYASGDYYQNSGSADGFYVMSSNLWYDYGYEFDPNTVTSFDPLALFGNPVFLDISHGQNVYNLGLQSNSPAIGNAKSAIPYGFGEIQDDFTIQNTRPSQQRNGKQSDVGANQYVNTNISTSSSSSSRSSVSASASASASSSSSSTGTSSSFRLSSLSSSSSSSSSFVSSPSLSVSPVILYLDTLSAPNSGGENNLGGYLSVFGSGFGVPSDLSVNTKVFIGGVEVSNYRYLGPAKVNQKMAIQQITVQIGHLVGLSVGSGYNVTVQVKGVHSSCGPNAFCTFYPCHGNVLFVSLSGNDNTAQLNNIAAPFRYLQNLATLTGAYFSLSNTPGDHIVIRGGEWSDANGQDTTWMRFGASQYARNGNISAWIHITAYPGSILGNLIEDVHYTTPYGECLGGAGCSGGIAGPWEAIAGTSGEYISVSNLRMEVAEGSNRDACPINFQYTAGPWRVVNNELGPWRAGNSSVLNCGGIAGHGYGNVIIGNYIHDIEGLSDQQNHGIYADSTAEFWEVSFNYIYNISAGSLIQFNDNQGYAGSYTLPHGGIWPGFIGITIHHNWLELCAKYGINFNDQGSTKIGQYDSRAWDNVIIGTGGPPIRTSSTQPNQTMWYAFNTIYDCMRVYSYTGNAMVRAEGWSSMMGVYNTFYNNIFMIGPSSDPNTEWFADAGGLPATVNTYDFKQNVYWSIRTLPANTPSIIGDTKAVIGDPLFVNVNFGFYNFTFPSWSPVHLSANVTLPMGWKMDIQDDFVRNMRKVGKEDGGAYQT